MVSKQTLLIFFCINLVISLSAMDQIISQEDAVDTAIRRLVQGRLCESMPGKKGLVQPKKPLMIVDLVEQIKQQELEQQQEKEKRKEEIRQKMAILKIQMAEKKQKEIEKKQQAQDKKNRDERIKVRKQNANKKQ